MAESIDIIDELHSEPDVEKEQFMTFRCEDEIYGISIKYVNEITGLQQITAVPETEDYIIGLINLRGKIIPVIDVRLRFKQEPFEYNDRTCIIVINVRDLVVGLIVEKIAEVVEIQEENILPSPSIGRADKSQNKYVYAIGKVGDDVKLLLDPDRLLNDEDKTVLERVSEDNTEEGEE